MKKLKNFIGWTFVLRKIQKSVALRIFISELQTKFKESLGLLSKKANKQTNEQTKTTKINKQRKMPKSIENAVYFSPEDVR